MSTHHCPLSTVTCSGSDKVGYKGSNTVVFVVMSRTHLVAVARTVAVSAGQTCVVEDIEYSLVFATTNYDYLGRRMAFAVPKTNVFGVILQEQAGSERRVGILDKLVALDVCSEVA